MLFRGVRENGRVTRASKPTKNGPSLRPVDSELEVRQSETGMEKDLRLLRKTIVDPESERRLSSPDAKQAAHRIFGRVDFVGMVRSHVLRMLGDPATLNNFTQKYKPGKHASLIYTFYSDDGFKCYILESENDRVTHVRGKPKTVQQ